MLANYLDPLLTIQTTPKERKRERWDLRSRAGMKELEQQSSSLFPFLRHKAFYLFLTCSLPRYPPQGVRNEASLREDMDEEKKSRRRSH
jgi:hypothetical protein